MELPELKHDRRIRHVIARDAFPYVALVQKKFSRFPFKARYVNCVHSVPFVLHDPTYRHLPIRRP